MMDENLASILPYPVYHGSRLAMKLPWGVRLLILAAAKPSSTWQSAVAHQNHSRRAEYAPSRLIKSIGMPRPQTTWSGVEQSDRNVKMVPGGGIEPPRAEARRILSSA